MAKRASLLSASKPQISRQVLTLAQVSMDSTGEMQMLPIDMIDPSPYQPREACNEKALDNLAASIKDVGIIQPVVVRPKDDKRYELVAGHRRWLAASHLAMNTIPAIIRPLDNKDASALSLIENLQREDLNPIETAQGLQRMIDEFAATQKDLAALIGRSKADITHTLGLLKLLPDVQSYIKRGDLSAGHGRVLYRIPHRQQQALAKKAFDKGWTVRKLEQVIAEQKANHALEVPRNPDITRLENVLAEYFSIPVKIRSDQKGSGCITLRYNTLAECEAILERIGLSPDHYQ